MEENTQKNSAIWYTVGAIVIIIAAFMIFRSPAEVTDSPTDTATTTDATTALDQEVALEVKDQFGTTTAVISRVYTDTPSWVVVREDINGNPGNILGASWVPAGETLNLTVELLRAATEGNTYHALVHTDDGNGGADFDLKTDLPLTDANGDNIMKSYKVIFDKG